MESITSKRTHISNYVCTSDSSKTGIHKIIVTHLKLLNSEQTENNISRNLFFFFLAT